MVPTYKGDEIYTFRFGDCYLIKTANDEVHQFDTLEDILSILIDVFNECPSYYPDVSVWGDLYVTPNIRWNKKAVVYPEGWMQRFADVIQVAIITHTLTRRWEIPAIELPVNGGLT
ncbi:MAG TPA: hypothetical protein VI522_04100 [Gammaproteobacteria bacterium]|nr:hypothetical protein [Gammaproteobacteria bacterium]